MPTGIAALIVTLQPILTNALSGPILNEKVSLKQWIGVLLGFSGAVMVLGFDIGTEIPTIGLVATVVALIAMGYRDRRHEGCGVGRERNGQEDHGRARSPCQEKGEGCRILRPGKGAVATGR